MKRSENMSQTELPKGGDAETLASADTDLPESRDRLIPATETSSPLVALSAYSKQQAELLEFVTIQEALRKSEQRYRSLVEAISQIIWATNAVGEIVTEQPQWGQFTGQSYQEYQGWGWLNAIHPDDQALTSRVWQEALANHSLYEIEYRVRRYDGEYRYLSGRAVPVVEADGTIREWVGINTDITERKQAEAARDRALAQAETAGAQLHSAFMQAPAAIATFRGSNHKIETVNWRYLQMVGKDDLQGKTVREAFSERDGQALFELLDRVYDNGKPFVGKEMSVLGVENGDRTQDEFWNVVYQPLLDAEGKVYGIMTHAVEVTEQVRARQEVEKKAEELAHFTQALKRSNQDLDQFAYVTSHDLKAPLRAISNLSEWIEEDLDEQLTEDSRQHLHLLRKRVHRMTALIDGILHYSRAGRVQKLETVNVETLLSDLIEFLAPPSYLVIRIEPGLPMLKTEKIPLEQVFMNLLNNAIKYVPAYEGRIEINVQDSGKFYQFAVKDNGAGIAPEFHHKIWGIFQRLEARDKVEGTGVGLSIVKKIVESRGGRVWIESELGKGATFCFTWRKQPQVLFD